MRDTPIRALAVLGFTLACGGSQSSQPPQSGLLPGDPAANATAALTNVTPGPVAAADVKSGVLLTRLFAAVDKSATVAQLNAAAAAVGATAIAASSSGSLLVELEVPRQSDAAHASALAKTLKAQPGIRFAHFAREAQVAVLPPNAQPADLDHLLATRFPQAWNARSAAPSDCSPRRVDVFVFDKFGTSASRPHFFDQIDPSEFVADPTGGDPEAEDAGHGYDVTSVLAAANDTAIPTGANPFIDCKQLHQVEAYGYGFDVAMKRALAALSASIAPQMVLNISMVSTTSVCGPAGDEPCTDDNVGLGDPDNLQSEIEERAILAGEWARVSAAQGLGGRVLMAVAAGNIDPKPNGGLARGYAGFRDATLAAPWTWATRLAETEAILKNPALWKSPDAALADLTFGDADVTTVLATLDQMGAPKAGLARDNLLIAGSTTKAEEFEALAESAFDFSNSDVKAVGENIHLQDQFDESGTSFAAPQVAGLASYLWVLSPQLSVAENAALIRKTSRANANTAGVIDAFGAVTQLVSVPDEQGVRLAMLDVNGDGNFDHLDLQQFVTQLHLGDPGFAPAARDYGRFDLNGDGFSGGNLIGALDLDFSSRLEGVTQLIEEYEVDMSEGALSDLQILCYYAYSDLYAKAPANHAEALAQRSLMLGPAQCVRARISASIPSSVSNGTTVLFTVTTGGESRVPAPNMLLNLAANCGGIQPSSGRTDANGQLTAQLMPGTGCGQITVTATASGDAGAPVLDTESFQASTKSFLAEYSFSATSKGSITAFGVTTDVDDEDLISSESQSQGTTLKTGAQGSVSFPQDNDTWSYGVHAHTDGPDSRSNSGTISGTVDCSQDAQTLRGELSAHTSGGVFLSSGFGGGGFTFTLSATASGNQHANRPNEANGFNASLSATATGMDPVSAEINPDQTTGSVSVAGHISQGSVEVKFGANVGCATFGSAGMSASLTWSVVPD